MKHQLNITRQITKREFPSLDYHLQEVSRIPLITAEEEVRLAQEIKKGKRWAFEKLIVTNLRFVVSVAKQYQNQGLSLGELLSFGHIGLIRAALGFDETRGFKFISYAVWWIRQRINHSLSEYGKIIRIPINRMSHRSKIVAARSRLEQQLERTPSLYEISVELGISEREVQLTLEVSSKHASIESPFVDGESNTYLDVLEDTEGETATKTLWRESLKKIAEQALGLLDKRTRNVLEGSCGITSSLDDCRYGEKTLEAQASDHGISRERVRQVRENGVNTVQKDYSIIKQMRSFLGEDDL